jgi:glucose/mannose-6-phosphate isomerase
VAGMGGSGIAGDVAALFADRHGTVPVVPVKSYSLPSWTGPQDLVVAVSHSGGTEETHACLDDAEQRGASISVVTSGGRLLERARAGGWPATVVPGGQQPRASLPYLATPTLVSLVRAGVLAEGLLDDLADVGDHVDALVGREGWDAGADSRLRAVAVALSSGLPVVYGGAGLAALVAERARCQINENAKRPAMSNALPEADHNELVGWETGLAGTPLAWWELRSPDDEHPQVARRFDATFAAAGDAFASRTVSELAGPTGIARFAVGVAEVDLVSVYLAFLGGVDPTPVSSIEALKATIARP